VWYFIVACIIRTAERHGKGKANQPRNNVCALCICVLTKPRKDDLARQTHDFLMRILHLESLGLGYIGELVAVDEDSAIEDDFPGGVDGY
jgi:hypothetical protein